MTAVFVQLSDLHIRKPGQLAYRQLDTADYLKKAIQSILTRQENVSAVVITGDLVDFGRVQEYEHLAQLLEPLAMPVYLLAGNHDHAEHLRQVFTHHSYLGTEGPIQYCVNIDSTCLIAIDSSVSKASHGELDEQRLQWLSDTLDQNQDKPVVVAMHHPPFLTGIQHMDQQNLKVGAEAFKALISQYKNVEHIICGHVHRAICTQFGHTVASIAPSPAHQVTLDLTPDGPSSWVLEPAGYRVLTAVQGQPVVNHLAYVASYDGPYPFYENGKLID